MAYVIQKEKKLDIKYNCDVLVAGGGCAGISAALAAARQGADVLLLEQEWILGGLATAGMVTVFLPLCDGMGNQHIFGIGEELLRLSIKYGYERRYPNAWLDGGTFEERKEQRFLVQFNPQLFAVAAEQLLLENGVKILYGTKVLDVVTEGGNISTAIINNREGSFGVVPKVVIDCTGDAEVAYLAGEEMQIYDENFASLWCYYAAYGGKENEGNGYNIYSANYKEERKYDGTKAEDLNELMKTVHKKLLESTMMLRERESNKDLMPVTMPSIPPIRMTRAIVGAYVLDESEEGKHFDDSIGHTTDWRKRGPVFSVPYRCLYAKTGNLLTAGRNISVTKDMWDITRCIPTCCVSGEGAGVAAALAAKQGKRVMDIDVKELQDILKQSDIIID